MADVAPAPSAQEQPHNLSSLQSFSNKMPHAVDEWEKEKEADDELIEKLLADAGGGQDELGDLLAEGEQPTGEKADDAVDYGDISDDDDDLLEEDGEDAVAPLENGDVTQDTAVDAGGDGWDAVGDDAFDDLFGDGDDTFMADEPTSEPVLNGASGASVLEAPQEVTKSALDELAGEPTSDAAPSVQDEEEEEDPDTVIQRMLFERSKQRLQLGGIDPDATAAPQSDFDLIERVFPDYDKEATPEFTKLFMKRRALYLTKPPPKAPAKIHPTRPAFDLAQDQERSFKLTSEPQSRKRTNEEANEAGVLFITKEEAADEESDENVDFADLDEEEEIGGVSVHDLRVLCEDWDTSTIKSLDDTNLEVSALAVETDNGFGESPAKRRRTSLSGLFESITRDEFESFDDPEALTAKLARRIPLDMNDPRLLLDVRLPTAADKPPQTSFGRRREPGGIAAAIHKKFNFSNDDEYERLVKENSIRAAVGNIPIEHAGVARRLQYPFYKTQLSNKELRNFHRPLMQFNKDQRVVFEKRLDYYKVKEMRKMAVKDAFRDSNSLTYADNGSMALLEYSEESPLMLSNTGMNSRILQYYRRKDEQDKFRPKEDIGEPKVLQEKDQSPFAKFGFVEPGQTVTTIHNNLFRAPAFKHEPRKTDFMIIKRHTGVDGDNFHLRNIDNLHVVGQQFPFMEVPGTHGRKVTSTQKARMKMIAFRIYNRRSKEPKSKQPYVPHQIITDHFPGSDVGQNRSKMREIMQYNKDHSSWEPKPEDVKFLDMEVLRNEIKPEDICLIDSMQVGARQMQDAGFDLKQIDDDKDAGENASIDAQLVHWRATKNFLAACGDNAMIALHGDGDPTGRGEGFSFVKISMKGGFQSLGGSAQDKIDQADKQTATGHKYNVRDQEDAYQAAIHQIWDKQANSLSAPEEPDLELEEDDNIDARIERNERNSSMANFGRTPRSEAPGTPGYFPRASDIDDGMSHISGSRISASDRHFMGQSDRVLRVTRRRRGPEGEWIEEVKIIDDPVVARQYKKRHDLAAQARLDELVKQGGAATPSGDGIQDPDQRAAMQAELQRLQKNRERRKVREAQKELKKRAKEKGGAVEGGEDGVLPGQTQRKCANCGRLGHIKTNKKLCPLLNGQWKDGVPPGSATSDSPAQTPSHEGPGGSAGDRPQPRLSTSFQF